ncbi:Dipeptide-binding protein [Serratia fonticola]|uniref:Dipeptide-binding protein n=1 Tax=Serratia fonticola TaxID=47917 RepID=A0A4U9WJ13_SERFO|nr:Dipeptide-binding protein [Serratia fonticola]
MIMMPTLPNTIRPRRERCYAKPVWGPLDLKLWVPTASQSYNPSPLKTAELLQADLAQVGINVTIVPVEGRFQEARLMEMNHDLTLTGWSTDSNDPDSFFRPLLSCAAIRSQTNYGSLV